MYKILIDSSQRANKSVSLIKIIDAKEHTLDVVSGNIDIVQGILDLLSKHNLKVTDVDEYFSVPGPGSFTGLKNGATVANILNWGLGRKKIDELLFPAYGQEPNIQNKKF
ncbi:hypothetical protein KAZ57_03745 [Patescibacteria group bacterium]|nr:hypothetical protein [Patescibacteria group bacterium]